MVPVSPAGHDEARSGNAGTAGLGDQLPSLRELPLPQSRRTRVGTLTVAKRESEPGSEAKGTETCLPPLSLGSFSDASRGRS